MKQKTAGSILTFSLLLILKSVAQTVTPITSFKSNMSLPVTYQNKMYFSPNDLQLWVADTTGAYSVVANFPINTGGGPNFLTNFNGKLYFIRDRGTNANPQGADLYVSDGTAAGTYITTAFPVTAMSLSDAFVYNQKLYYKLNAGPTNCQLWVTDGTVGGAKMLKTCNSAQNFIGYNSSVYLDMDDGVHGQELWVINNNDVASLVMDINPGPAAGSPSNFTILNGKLCFTATVNNLTGNWWMTDGTAAGTHACYTPSDPTFNLNGNYAVFNNSIYFSSLTTLCIFDGVTIRKIQDYSPAVRIGPYGVLGSNLLFDIYSTPNSAQLWYSNGAITNGQLAKLLISGTQGIIYLPQSFSFRNKVYFTGFLQNSFALWIIDQTNMTATQLPYNFSALSPIDINVNHCRFLYGRLGTSNIYQILTLTDSN
jgi:ELWxxDGT repeat protein